MRRALGKGLSHLIVDENRTKVLNIPIDQIRANPKQPRTHFNEDALEDLAKSIREFGIIQPIIVRQVGAKFEIIAGERRWRAAKIAELATVPALVRDTSGHALLEVALIENLQREDLNPIETAKAFGQLMDEFDLTQDEIAKRVGKSRSAIANQLRLLRLPKKIQDSLESGQVTEGLVRPLLSLKSEAEQLAVFNKLSQGQLAARQVEKIVRERQKPGYGKRKSTKEADADWLAAADSASQAIGSPVEISGSIRGGTITIRFFDEDDLIRIFDRIGVKLD